MHANKYASSLNKDHGILLKERISSMSYILAFKKKNKEIEKSKKKGNFGSKTWRVLKFRQQQERQTVKLCYYEKVSANLENPTFST